VSAVDEALPRDDVPEVIVEKIPVVKVGLSVVAIVPVEERTMFDPAFRKEIGELKNEPHCVVEAVRGTVYPAASPGAKVCTPVPVLVVTVSVSPFADVVANVCEATVDPLSDVIVPPAPPASVPQKNCPVVVE
jgi:hypothetical protein